MRRLLQLVTASVFFTAIACAQPLPLSDRNLTVRAQVTNFDGATTYWKTSWGSYARYYEKQRLLDVTVKAVGEVETQFALLWYFFGRDSGTGSGRVRVIGYGDKVASLGPGNFLALKIDSPLFGGTEAQYRALGISSTKGLKPWGWGIAVIQGGKVITSTGSTPECAGMATAEASAFLEKGQSR